VMDILRDTAMAPGDLQLEVTESFAAQDELVTQRLQELAALGIQLALDDFGTGYSSLACLHQLPVHVVKIDRSFVGQVASSNHHRVLIEATILVARSLGMGTVAEGIETEEQAAALARLQCDKGQGYLFARPMTAQQASQWLAGRSRPVTAPDETAALTAGC
ncbi:MAG: EAL domain-containing protein, partial [Variovorax sp.]